MTDSQFLLQVLSEHSATTNQILRRSLRERQCGLTVHSRVSDLRKAGHLILCDALPGRNAAGKVDYRYTLVKEVVSE